MKSAAFRSLAAIFSARSFFSSPFILLSIFVVGAIAYLPGVDGPFLFDDLPNITQNQLLKLDLTVMDHWRTASLSSDSGPLRRPVTMFTFALNNAFSNESAAIAFKATNLFLHLGIGTLVYVFAKLILTSAMPQTTIRGLDRDSISLLAAAIWTLHPLHVSTVLYPVQRMAQLSTLFVLIGLVIFTYKRRQWAEQGATPGSFIATFLWLGFFAYLAVFSKENGILLIWLILVVEVAVFKGAWNRALSIPLRRFSWLMLMFPVFAIAILLAIYPDPIVGGFRGRDFTVSERLLTQVRVLWNYIGWFVFPDIRAMGLHHDSVVYSSGVFRPWTTFISLMAWVVTLLVAIKLRERCPLFILSILFFLTAHSMESSVLPLEMVYEHRNYLPTIGLSIGLAFSLAIAVSKFAAIARPTFILVALMLILCASLAARAFYWGDSLRLYRAELSQNPMSPRAHFFYGDALLSQLHRNPDLSNEQRREFILLSHAAFQRMFDLNPKDISASVMLYMLESRYLPEISSRDHRIPSILDAMEARPPQASDRAALRALVGFAIESGDPSVRTDVDQFLQAALKRNPLDVQLLMLKHLRLMADSGSLDERMQILRDIRESAPWRFDAFYYSILGYVDRGDVESMYATVGEWMRQDSKRRHLSIIRPLFKSEN